MAGGCWPRSRTGSLRSCASITGRGPIKAKTYVLDNLIVCVLTDGFIAIERTMMEGGEPERVLDMRRDFQRMMKERYSEMIEESNVRYASSARPTSRRI